MAWPSAFAFNDLHSSAEAQFANIGWEWIITLHRLVFDFGIVSDVPSALVLVIVGRHAGLLWRSSSYKRCF
jgi:hypothetical protein